MGNQDISAAPNIARIITIVVGVVVLGLGLHSHFESHWVQGITFAGRPYQICENHYFRNFYRGFDAPCPRIEMERFFVAIIIICFIVSLVFLALMFVMSAAKIKILDMVYHGIAAILLVIAGILYIVSAEQISILNDRVPLQGHIGYGGFHFYRGEKIAAGALAIINGVIYAVTGFLIFSARSS